MLAPPFIRKNFLNKKLLFAKGSTRLTHFELKKLSQFLIFRLIIGLNDE